MGIFKFFRRKKKSKQRQFIETKGKIRVWRQSFNGRVKYKQWVKPVRWNKKTVWVELPDGNIIKRRRIEIINGKDETS